MSTKRALPLSEISENPRRKTRQIGKASTDIDALREEFGALRSLLMWPLKCLLKAELLEGDPVRQKFANYMGLLNYETLANMSILKVASLVPKEKAEPILRRWLGKTERERSAALEVIDQMQSGLVPLDASMPSSLHRFIGCDYDTIIAIFSAEDAKDLCNAWNPAQNRSLDLRPEELTRAAKRLCDALGNNCRARRATPLDLTAF